MSDDVFLLMSPGRVHRFYIWRRRESWIERSAAPRSSELSWERSMLRRVQVSLARLISAGRIDPGRSDCFLWNGFEDRGTDEHGIALFSAYLDQQEQHWLSAEAGEGESAREACTYAGCASFVVRRRAEDLDFHGDKRTLVTTDYVRAGVVISRAGEGSIPEEESRERQGAGGGRLRLATQRSLEVAKADCTGSAPPETSRPRSRS